MTPKDNDIFVKGSELLAFIKQKIKEGNVRRLIIKNSRGKKMLEVSLTAGIGIGGVLAVIAPVLVVISSVAAWLAEFRIEVIRAGDADGDTDNPSETGDTDDKKA
jgi:hypothetical protein